MDMKKNKTDKISAVTGLNLIKEDTMYKKLKKIRKGKVSTGKVVERTQSLEKSQV